jgi:hypothetical protein
LGRAPVPALDIWSKGTGTTGAIDATSGATRLKILFPSFYYPFRVFQRPSCLKPRQTGQYHHAVADGFWLDFEDRPDQMLVVDR